MITLEDLNTFMERVIQSVQAAECREKGREEEQVMCFTLSLLVVAPFTCTRQISLLSQRLIDLLFNVDKLIVSKYVAESINN